MAPITFITDFGLSDEYAGVMKGVILSINPSATLVDITHRIAPQDIRQAGCMLAASYKYFPRGSIHTAIVDPSVGSNRKILLVQMSGHRFIVPDNGLITPVFAGHDSDLIISIENPAFFLERISATFHGRDIFAPVAAHLSLGLDPFLLGPEIRRESITQIDFPAPFTPDGTTIEGYVVSIDRFGNLITDISEQMLKPILKMGSNPSMETDYLKEKIKGLVKSYHEGVVNVPIVILSSRQVLEIAINHGSAQKYFGSKTGDLVRVSIGIDNGNNKENL